jgi:hypothetical protein
VVRGAGRCGAHARHHDAGDGRPDHPRRVHEHRVERHRVQQVLAADQVADEGLAGGHLEGEGDAADGRQRQQVPRLGPAAEDQHGDGGRRRGGQQLREDDQAALVDAVGDGAGQR